MFKRIKRALGLGGSSETGHFSFPSPLYNYETGSYDHRGMVWMGKRPCTLEDVAKLEQAMGHKITVDPYSLCGRESPEWSSFRREHQGKPPYKSVLKF